MDTVTQKTQNPVEPLTALPERLEVGKTYQIDINTMDNLAKGHFTSAASATMAYEYEKAPWMLKISEYMSDERTKEKAKSLLTSYFNLIDDRPRYELLIENVVNKSTNPHDVNVEYTFTVTKDKFPPNWQKTRNSEPAAVLELQQS